MQLIVVTIVVVILVLMVVEKPLICKKCNCPVQCPHTHTYTDVLHPSNWSVGDANLLHSQDKEGKPDISRSILNACEEHSWKITWQLHHWPAQKAVCELKCHMMQPYSPIQLWKLNHKMYAKFVLLREHGQSCGHLQGGSNKNINTIVMCRDNSTVTIIYAFWLKFTV